MNNSYILNGSRLYEVVYSGNSYIRVRPSKKKLTKSMSKRTYYKNQLEVLGYTIGGDFS